MREAPLKTPFAAQAVAVVDFANKYAHQHKDIPRLETANKSLMALLRLPKFANLNCRPGAPSVLRKRVPLGSWHSNIGAYEVLQRYDVDVFIEHAMVSLADLASQVSDANATRASPPCSMHSFENRSYGDVYPMKRVLQEFP